jgi:hypothetical protein
VEGEVRKAVDEYKEKEAKKGSAKGRSIAKIVDRLSSTQSGKGGTRTKENVQLLTKELEDQLLLNSREKVLESVKNSSAIHDILELHNIDKLVMIDILYQDNLFRYRLAHLLFKMKVVVKKKLEEFIL